MPSSSPAAIISIRNRTMSATAVHGARRIARIIDAGREPPRQIEPPLHHPQSQKPGVRRQRPAVAAGGDRRAVHG
jgi:hypothetical protein